MKIGIDARPLVATDRAGISNYLYNILNKLEVIDQENEYYLYSHKDYIWPLGNKRWHKRIGSKLLSASGTLYMLTEGKGQMIKDKLDVFWGTQHLLPLNLAVKKVLTIHDFTWHHYPQTMTKYNYWINCLLAKRSLADADAIIAVSQSTANDAIRIFASTPNKTFVIHNGIGEQYKSNDRLEAARSVAGKYATPDKYILTVGTMEPRKNMAVLLRSFEALMSEYTAKMQLLLIGSKGWNSAEVYRTYHESGFSEDQVKFLGYVPEDAMPKFYRGAELFVYPSRYEGFGLPPLEAMACGCPVVVSNTSSLPEVCGDAAVYVDPNSVQSIKEGMCKILTDNELKEKLVELGLKRAKMFTWEKAARSVLEVLNRA